MPCASPVLSWQLLRPLTALTSLEFTVCQVKNVVHVLYCTALQRVKVGCNDGDETELDAAHWQALGRLMRFTHLQLLNALAMSAPVACFSALRALHNLRHFGVWEMTTDILPALCVCTQLAGVTGGWRLGVIDGHEDDAANSVSVIFRGVP